MTSLRGLGWARSSPPSQQGGGVRRAVRPVAARESTLVRGEQGLGAFAPEPRPPLSGHGRFQGPSAGPAALRGVRLWSPRGGVPVGGISRRTRPWADAEPCLPPGPRGLTPQGWAGEQVAKVWEDRRTGRRCRPWPACVRAACWACSECRFRGALESEFFNKLPFCLPTLPPPPPLATTDPPSVSTGLPVNTLGVSCK